MFAHERRNAIKKILRSRQRIAFAELHAELAVSPATLRRDLTELEEAGEIIRVHGGVLDPGALRAEATFAERKARRNQAKRAIARAAAALVPPGARVFVDAGSTCLEAGGLLLGREDVTIVTNSVPLLTAAGERSAARVIMLGGELRRVSGALTGAGALGNLARLRADLAFIGASGLHPEEGASTTELSECAVKAAFAARADRAVLLADHSKWARPSTVVFAGWDAFHDWITDHSPTPAESATLRAARVRIQVA